MYADDTKIGERKTKEDHRLMLLTNLNHLVKRSQSNKIHFNTVKFKAMLLEPKSKMEVLA